MRKAVQNGLSALMNRRAMTPCLRTLSSNSDDQEPTKEKEAHTSKLLAFGGGLLLGFFCKSDYARGLYGYLKNEVYLDFYADCKGYNNSFCSDKTSRFLEKHTCGPELEVKSNGEKNQHLRNILKGSHHGYGQERPTHTLVMADQKEFFFDLVFSINQRNFYSTTVDGRNYVTSSPYDVLHFSWDKKLGAYTCEKVMGVHLLVTFEKGSEADKSCPIHLKGMMLVPPTPRGAFYTNKTLDLPDQSAVTTCHQATVPSPDGKHAPEKKVDENVGGILVTSASCDLPSISLSGPVTASTSTSDDMMESDKVNEIPIQEKEVTMLSKPPATGPDDKASTNKGSNLTIKKKQISVEDKVRRDDRPYVIPRNAEQITVEGKVYDYFRAGERMYPVDDGNKKWVSEDKVTSRYHYLVRDNTNTLRWVLANSVRARCERCQPLYEKVEGLKLSSTDKVRYVMTLPSVKTKDNTFLEYNPDDVILVIPTPVANPNWNWRHGTRKIRDGTMKQGLFCLQHGYIKCSNQECAELNRRIGEKEYKSYAPCRQLDKTYEYDIKDFSKGSLSEKELLKMARRGDRLAGTANSPEGDNEVAGSSRSVETDQTQDVSKTTDDTSNQNIDSKVGATASKEPDGGKEIPDAKEKKGRRRNRGGKKQ